MSLTNEFDKARRDSAARPLGHRSRPSGSAITGHPLESDPLAMQRLVGNRATAMMLNGQAGSPHVLQRQIMRDPHALTDIYQTGYDEGQPEGLDDLVRAVLAARPDLASKEDKIRDLMRPYAGVAEPDFAYSDADAAASWLGAKLGIPETTPQDRYEDALAKFAANMDQISFSRTGDAPKFDNESWKCTVKVSVDDEVKFTFPYSGKNWRVGQGKLRDYEGGQHEIDYEFKYVLDGKQPSAAVARIYERPELWALDCIEFIVAARLYAELAKIGPVAFDQKYTNVGTALQPAPMTMAQHATPGLSTHVLWERDAPTEFFRQQDALTKVVLRYPAEEDRFLATLPIGSRVMWSTNFEDGSVNEDMRNENTIKVGETSYAAHPMGVMTPSKIRDELIFDDDIAPGETRKRLKHGRQFVYVREIEWYEAPKTRK